MKTNSDGPAVDSRRGFFSKVAAMIIGTITMVIPSAAGLMVFFDPLRRKSTQNEKMRIATLDALPNDGVPRKFSILAARTDAWNKFSNSPIGAVYLRRTAESKVEALNVVCPHAGCFVDFRSDTKSFFCPCHNSSFSLDGKIADPKSPSPRAMDTLEAEVRNNEIWVKFQNFRTGQAEKVAQI